MDSLKVPDNISFKDLQSGSRTGRGMDTASDIFASGRYERRTRMGGVDTNYEGSEKRAKARRDAAENEDDSFIPRQNINKKAPDLMHQGVKVGSSYVERKKIVIWITTALLLLACALLFLPPLMNSTTEETKVDFDRNIFAKMGMTEFKAYALSNYSVYNQEAFSSEKNENYRVIEMQVHVQNSSPFEVEIPQYYAAHVPAKYEEKVCYVTSAETVANKDGTKKVVGDKIPGFSGKDVTIDLMINVTDMTEEELDECVTGMVLSTTGAKKRITGKITVPCLPAFLFVSDTVTVPLHED